MNSKAIYGDFPAELNQHFDAQKSTFITFAPDSREFPLLLKHCAKVNQQSFRLLEKEPLKKQGKKVESKEREDKTELISGLGLHSISYDGHDMYVYVQTHGKPVGSSCGVTIYETCTLFYPNALGKQDILHAFVEHLISLSEEKKDGMDRIYSFHMKYQYWRNNGSRLKRPLSSIFLEKSKLSKIVDDITDFLDTDTAQWYGDHGIPYKRSYMFHGPPGSGKSSLIHALCSHFDRNICFLQPCHELMTDDLFKEALSKCPTNSVIVLEDIDSLFTVGREKLNGNCPLTFSGFLNGIDGFGSPEGQLFMMTTNYIDRLDSALTRAGRVDLKVELGCATEQQIKGMFLSFYPDQEECAKVFAAKIHKSAEICMASLQNHFIYHRRSDSKTASTNIDFESLIGRTELLIENQKKEEEERKKKQSKKTREDEEKRKREDEDDEADEKETDIKEEKMSKEEKNSKKISAENLKSLTLEEILKIALKL